MIYTIDTKFHDKGHNRIDLLSVGVVSEKGAKYYAVVKDTDWQAVKQNQWLVDNVVPALGDPRLQSKAVPWRTRKEIKGELKVFFANDTNPKFWAYFADWDWILFSHIFGNLLELGDSIPNAPQLCLDIKQEMMRLHIPRAALTDQSTVEHNALNDAEWNMQILREIVVREKRMSGSSWIGLAA